MLNAGWRNGYIDRSVSFAIKNIALSLSNFIYECFYQTVLLFKTRVRTEEFPTSWAKLKWFVLKRLQGTYALLTPNDTFEFQ